MCFLWFNRAISQTVPQLKEIADQHFDAAQYTEAITFYKKITRLDKTGDEAQYRLATSYYRTLQYQKAKKQFLKLISKPEGDFRHPAIYYYGTILKLESEFVLADSTFAYLITLPDVNDELLESSRKQSEGCQLALNHKAQDRGFTITEMKELNSRFHDFGGVINKQNDALVFVTSRKVSSGQYAAVQYDGLLPDLVQFAKRNNNWRDISSRNRFDNLNTRWSEGSGSFTADGKSFYFTSCQTNDGSDCKVMISRFVNDRWTSPNPLNEYINEQGFESKHPFVTPLADTLFFVSNREGGYGGNDIWMSLRGIEEDSWTPAINMGDVINTVSNEITPYYSSAYRSLLFSSDGHVGYGGFDIFAAKGESFYEPHIYNLGDPFNSPLDDTYFSISDSVGFISSNRNDRTHLNLYSFPVSNELLYLSLLISGESLIDQRIVSRFKAVRTLDLTTFRVEDYQGFDLFEPPKRKKARPGILGGDSIKEDGMVSDALIAANAQNNSRSNSRLSATQQYSELQIGTTDIVSTAQLAGYEKSDFEKVYFEFASTKLSKQAKLSLDNLINQVKGKMDDIQYIQVVANTDDVGSNQSNLKLSANRGNSVREYLVNKGYPGRRIIIDAKGEDNRVNNGNSWYDRFFDRRAEIFVYSTQPLTIDKSRKLLIRKDMNVDNASEILRVDRDKIKIWNEMGSDFLKKGEVIRIDEPVFASNIKYFLDETDVKNKFFPYIVEAGETIAAVARKFRTPEELLVEINQLDREVRKGDVVFVYNVNRNVSAVN